MNKHFWEVVIIILLTLFFSVKAVKAELTSVEDLNLLHQAESSLINNFEIQPLNENHWVYKTLKNVYLKNNLSNSDIKEKFDINEPLTRSEAAVILVSLIGHIEQNKIHLSEGNKIQLDLLKNELNEELTSLSGRIEHLEEEFNELNTNVVSLKNADKKILKVDYGENFQINGAFVYRYTGNLKGIPDSDPSGFRIRLAELKFNGNMHKNLKYNLTTQIQRDFDSSSNSLFTDAYLMTDKFKNHEIYFGQTRTPIGKEGTTSRLDLLTIERSQIATNFSNFRDFGLRINGEYNLFDYYIGAYNGNGMNYSDNQNKDLSYSGWLVLKPLHKVPKFGKLEIGGGQYFGKHSIYDDNVYQKDVSQKTYGLFSSYELGRNNITVEWGQKNGYRDSESRKASGFYVQNALFLNKKKTHQLVTKYDSFDSDKSISNNHSNEYTLGYNYLIKGRNLKIMLNAVHVDNKAEDDSQRFIIQSQFAF